MTDTADNTPALPTSGKRKRIPTKVRAACDAMLANEAKTVTDAAALAGLSREYLSRQLGRADVMAYLEDKTRRKAMLARVRVVNATDDASERMIELIRADSEHVSFDASREVLAIAGIKSKGDTHVNLNLEVRAGYVLDLREPGERAPQVIDVTPAPPPRPADPFRLGAPGFRYSR